MGMLLAHLSQEGQPEASHGSSGALQMRFRNDLAEGDFGPPKAALGIMQGLGALTSVFSDRGEQAWQGGTYL